VRRHGGRGVQPGRPRRRRHADPMILYGLCRSSPRQPGGSGMSLTLIARRHCRPRR
jgi:hypothetical protein